jgi:2,4-dienoyl-CoA reductase-like NADH-dependent reductase (Old Yellow Enzyme family)
MSGGSFNYAYVRVSEFAAELQEKLNDPDYLDFWPREVEKEIRETLAQAKYLAVRMKEVEWLYSADTSPETFLVYMRDLKENSMVKTVLNWKNNEYDYCLMLVKNGGNSRVPKGAVSSYLDKQIASARRDGRDDVVLALRVLKNDWDNREHVLASCPQPEKQECIGCGLRTQLDDEGLCNLCHDTREAEK